MGYSTEIEDGPFAVYDASGEAVGTVEATSEKQAVEVYVQQEGLKRLPKGWFVESIYA